MRTKRRRKKKEKNEAKSMGLENARYEIKVEMLLERPQFSSTL